MNKLSKVTRLVTSAATILVLAAAFVGCAALDKNADPIEVRAEQTIQTASDTIDLFIGVEYDNQALIEAKLPAVHQFAEYLRERMPNDPKDSAKGSTPRGLAMVDSVNAVRRAYKANRTPENQASLTAAVAALQETIDQVEARMAEWSAVKTLISSGTNSTPAPAPWDGTSK